MLKEKKCITCEKIFLISETTRKKKYCSDNCRKLKFPKSEKQCKFCNKNFIVEYRFRNQIFCSMHCHKQCIVKESNKLRELKNKITCLYCNEEFIIKTSLLSTQKYCS